QRGRDRGPAATRARAARRHAALLPRTHRRRGRRALFTRRRRGAARARLAHARARGRTVGRTPMTDAVRSFMDKKAGAQALEQIPPGLVEMLSISGLGVAKIRQIHEVLDIDSVPELEAAARDGRLTRLPRFGPKTSENILKGIAFMRQASAFRLLHHASDEAE